MIPTTGGGGAMIVDQLSARGVVIAGASAATRAYFDKHNIPCGQGKLVDVTLAGARYEVMKRAVSTLIRDPDTGVLVVAIGSSAQFDPELAVNPIADAVAEAPADAAPVLAFPLPHAPDSMRLLEAAGVPTFRTVESCAETLAMLMADAVSFDRPAPVLDARAQRLIGELGPGTVDEVASGAVFDAIGLTGPAQIILDPAMPLPAVLPLPIRLLPSSSHRICRTKLMLAPSGLASRIAIRLLRQFQKCGHPLRNIALNSGLPASSAGTRPSWRGPYRPVSRPGCRTCGNRRNGWRDDGNLPR